METSVEERAAQSGDISFARLITTSISARLLIDISVQMFNPFLPIFATGLKTDVVTLGRVLSLRSLMGLLAPLFGSWADRYGYRRVMRIALITAALGLWIIGLSSNVFAALPGFILLGLALAGFTPTLQAYLSARLPYARRARGMGMLEYSWALTGIVGLSMIGLLIDWAGWRLPFLLLGAGLIVMVFVFSTLPAATHTARPQTETEAKASWSQRVAGLFHITENADSTYTTIIAAAFSYYASMQLMIVHGAWFAAEYGFDAPQLGLAALIFGCFDLTASVSVSLFTDRFGKRRSVILGSAGALLGYLLIPLLNVGAWPAVLSAALARGFFEFAIVANIPLLSEQAPSQRAKVMTLGAAAGLTASTLATFFAPSTYVHFGIGGVAAISALCTVVTLVLLIWRVREGGETAAEA